MLKKSTKKYRKYIKNQLLELIETLLECLMHLKQNPITYISDIKLVSLECLQYMVSLFDNDVESSYFKYTIACKNNIISEDFNNALLKANLLKDAIKKDLPIYYEIVFMPYKADMWDCLESIWYAAKKTENCNVHVVPLPYYNLVNRHIDGEVIFEGDRFPSYVDITIPSTYDLKAMRPDVIFIHNPYDDYNTIINVQPDYYSDKLIKYTDKLVYIPYFVALDTVPKDLCYMPGIENAWRIFVQSEYVKKEFIKYNPPEKIIAMGSPKIDKVINARLSDFDIPKKWAIKIKNKKVILLSTHLRNVYKNIKDFIKIIEEIISLFYSKDDQVLLWRPHPLIRQAIHSYYADYIDVFTELTKKVNDMPNGIYDDSSDYHRAMFISDAYWGDWSSIVIPYSFLDKEIYLFEYTLPKEAERIEHFPNGCIVGSYFYYINNENYLQKASLETFTIETKNYLGNYFTAYARFKPLAYINGYLWFIPNDSYILYCITLDGEFVKDYDIGVIDKPDIRFLELFEYRGSIYILSYNYNYLIEVDIAKGTIYKYLLLDIDENEKRKHYLIGDYELINGKLLLPFLMDYQIVVFDLETKQINRHCHNYSFTGIAYDGENIWLASFKGKSIVKYNIKTASTEELIIDLIEDEYLECLHCFACGEYIWFFTHWPMFIRINKNTNEIDYIQPENIWPKDYPNNYWGKVHKKDNILLVPPFDTDYLNIIDTDTLSIKNAKLSQSFVDCFMYGLRKDRQHHNKHIVPNFTQEVLNTDGTSGMKIWQYVLNALEHNIL